MVEWALPVSYTHLDVYKRQALNTIQYQTETEELIFYVGEKAYKEELEARDVYKRQPSDAPRLGSQYWSDHQPAGLQ